MQYREFARDGVEQFSRRRHRRGSLGRRSRRSLFFVERVARRAEGLSRRSDRGSTSSSTSADSRATASTTSRFRRRSSCRPSSSSRERRFVGPPGDAAVRAPDRREADRPRPRRARWTSTTRIAEVFDERQIFRIDHYLGKETVQNILVLRFANSFFEPLFNQKYIDHVQITVAEEEGVGTRAGYYDQAGALRDMVQNHCCSCCALVAMEPPHSLDADVIRDEKLEVLQSLRPLTATPSIRASCAPNTAPASPTASQVPGVPRGSRRQPVTRRPKRSSRCRSSSTTGDGPACRSSCGPASGCRNAPAKSRFSSRKFRRSCSTRDADHRLERRTC